MSFSDVGRKAKNSAKLGDATVSRTQVYSSILENNVAAQPGYSSSTVAGSKDAMFAQLSDGILQYQRNVGILQKIASGVGSANDGPTLQTQLNCQVDVISQLGGRIDQQLRAQETRIQRMSRTDASRNRATHVKLTRDFRRVEATFNKLKLELKQRRGLVEARRAQEEDERRFAAEASSSEQAMRLEMQLQEDQLNEQLMREREAEIREINKGMHTVNEIYKDLAHIVQTQQEDVDKIEGVMEDANNNAKTGLKHIEKAASHQSQCTIS